MTTVRPDEQIPDATWSIDLSKPPLIEQCGIGVHGYDLHELYLLPDLWCLHLYRYDADVTFDGRRYPIRPGFVSVVAPGVPIVYDYRGKSVHIYAHFRLSTGVVSDSELRSVPVMYDLGMKFAEVTEEVDCFTIAHTPVPRLQSALWSLLWRLSDVRAAASTAGLQHPAVQTAVRRIEQHLADEISVADLAKEACVSYSYLGKLFQQEFGTSVVGFIRERRMRKAIHLLQQSTMSVKSVATSVGIPDLHLFNKTVRRATGLSPRAVRDRIQG